MNKLSQRERTQIALQEIDKSPKETICTIAAVKLAEIVVTTNAATAEIETTANINKKNYKIKLVATCEEIKG